MSAPGPARSGRRSPWCRRRTSRGRPRCRTGRRTPGPRGHASPRPRGPRRRGHREPRPAPGAGRTAGPDDDVGGPDQLTTGDYDPEPVTRPANVRVGLITTPLLVTTPLLAQYPASGIVISLGQAKRLGNRYVAAPGSPSRLSAFRRPGRAGHGELPLARRRMPDVASSTHGAKNRLDRALQEGLKLGDCPNRPALARHLGQTAILD